jgi:hypothetical protein
VDSQCGNPVSCPVIGMRCCASIYHQCRLNPFEGKFACTFF